MIPRIATVVLLLTILIANTTPARAASGTQASGPLTAQQAMLISVSRNKVTLRDDVIRLGDLFTNTGAKANMVVESAPSAGSQAVFDVHRLATIARTHGLVWQAHSWSEKVTLDRASQAIASDQVLLALRAALEKNIAPEGRWDIELTGRSDLTLTLPMDKPATMAIENLRHNRATGQFAAVVTAPANDPTALRLNIAGRVLRMIDVPTLNRRIPSGDVITANDITWISMRTKRVGRNVITDAERIIGMTPKRTAIANKVLMNGDLRAPRVVTKGSLVTLLLKTPHMVLTSKGRALEHGARGNTIKVMNTHSKTIVEGEVTSSGIIHVKTANFLPLDISGPVHNAAAARR